MIEEIPAAIVYPDSRFFLDYLAGRSALVPFFSRRGIAKAAAARSEVRYPREELAAALAPYNASIGGSGAGIEALRGEETLCVMTGQQAGFLGGPAYTAYKILSCVRLAERLRESLGVPVVPIFWLASEDHDFTEINRIRLLGPDGSLRTVSFGWEERSRPIEELPITEEAMQAAEGVLDRLPNRTRSLFLPAEGDDYATWHARIWARLFADDGLVLVEPRVVRHLGGRFFEAALAGSERITAAIRRVAERLTAAGYEPPLDPERAGRPFLIDRPGARRRVVKPGEHAGTARREPHRYSSDAALRPILVDSIFPTVAHVLGPGEIAYHAMLIPLYRLFDVPPSAIVPRHGYTLLSAAEDELLRRLGLTIEEAMKKDFDAKSALRRAASPALRSGFEAAYERMREAISPLLPVLSDLDPGLEASWKRASDRALRGVRELEERAIRTELARRSISARDVHALIASLRPGGRPQERGLSFVHFVRRFGVEWIRGLPGRDKPERFAHYAVTIEGEG